MTRNDPWVLGISASHNGAACLLHGDEIVVAVQEERLSRVKRDRIHVAKPSRAIDYCLRTAGIGARDLDAVVSCAQTGNCEEDLRRNPQLEECRGRALLCTIPHHYGHAVSAFATSGFADAAVLVLDGMGSPTRDLREDERAAVIGNADDGWESASLFLARGIKLTAVEKHLVRAGRWLGRAGARMPDFGSLGGMYSSAAVQIFGNDMEAGKVMGLAPYGEGDIPVDEFVEYDGREFYYPNRVQSRFTSDDRWPRLQNRYQNLAASTQAALEHAVLAMLRQVSARSGTKRLCYAGGVALNSVLNERVITEAGFDQVFVVPAAEDSGVAIGAAYHGLWALTGTNSRRRLSRDSHGKSYTADDVTRAANEYPSLSEVRSVNVEDIVVELLVAGKSVAWFRDGSELGPRALGQRSILCDPRRSDAKAMLNHRVKRREAFRPFAPVVPLEHVNTYFDLAGAPRESPFMLRVCRFRPDKRCVVPAVVHVDGTGRLQTVTAEENAPLHNLVQAFGQRTGVPVLLNTSFNVMGEPIVETPSDALSCLAHSGLDACAFADRVYVKA